MLFSYDLIVPCLHAPQPTPDQKNPMLTTGVTRMLAKRRTASIVLALKIHPSRWRSRSTRHDCESPTRLWAGGGDVASRDDAVRERRRVAPCGVKGVSGVSPPVRSMPGGVLAYQISPCISCGTCSCMRRAVACVPFLCGASGRSACRRHAGYPINYTTSRTRFGRRVRPHLLAL